MGMHQARIRPFQTGFRLPDFQQLAVRSGIGFSEKSARLGSGDSRLITKEQNGTMNAPTPSSTKQSSRSFFAEVERISNDMSPRVYQSLWPALSGRITAKPET